jgi:hypothetical protein
MATTFGIYDKLDHVERIHGHGGKSASFLWEIHCPCKTATVT